MKSAFAALSCLAGSVIAAAAVFLLYLGCCCVIPVRPLTQPVVEQQRAVPAAQQTQRSENWPNLAERRTFRFDVTRPRNVMTLGALRCDSDISLYTLLATFLI